MDGLIIRNADGNIQFSTNFKNYCLAAKGTTTSYTAWSSVGISLRLFTISYTANGASRPLCGARGGAFFGVTNVGNVYTFSFLSSSSTTSIEYFIFDEVPLIPTSNGLNIWSAAGELIYSSDFKPLKVRAVIKGSCGFNTDPWATSPGNKATSEDFIYDSGRDYVPIITRPSFAKSYFYQGAGNYRLSTWIVSASSIANGVGQGMTRYSAESATTTSPDAGQQRFALSRGILVADVTHF